MKQVLQEAMSLDRLKKTLSDYTGLAIDLRLHEKAYLLFRYEKPSRKTLLLTLHESFLYAPDPILFSLASCLLKKEKKKLTELRLFLEHPFFQKKPSTFLGSQEGAVYHLKPLYESVEKTYLPYKIHASIAWKKFPYKKKRSSITYGTYCRRKHHIEINDLLDAKKIPKYFIEYVIYHEALHAIFPAEMGKKGEMRVHTKAFKEEEKTFPFYKQATAFGKQFLQEINKRNHYGRP